MHIIMGFLTAVAGVIWALYRLQQSGVDLNSFNPFYWMRRRQWQRKYGAKPLHQLNKPLEAASVLIVAAVKTEGEVSREQKQAILDIFTKEFRVEANVASDLFVFSAFLLKDVINIVPEVRHILAPSKASFSAAQIESLLALLERVSLLDGALSDVQGKLIEEVRKELSQATPASGKWQS